MSEHPMLDDLFIEGVATIKGKIEAILADFIAVKTRAMTDGATASAQTVCVDYSPREGNLLDRLNELAKKFHRSWGRSTSVLVHVETAPDCYRITATSEKE